MRFFVLPIFDGVIMDGYPNILIVVDTGYAGIRHSKFLVRIVLFLHFIGRIYLSKYYNIISLASLE